MAYLQAIFSHIVQVWNLVFRFVVYSFQNCQYLHVFWNVKNVPRIIGSQRLASWVPAWSWLQPFLFILHFCYTFQELDHQMKYNFCQYKQSNIYTLGIFNCFQSNLLSYCQQIFYPEDIIGLLLMLTLPSYGEMISFLLSFHWFFLIICLSRKVCKNFKVFSRGTVLFLHISFSLALEQCAGCKKNVFRVLHFMCTHTYSHAREWEIYFIAWSEYLSKIYSINFSQDLPWINILCLNKKCGICMNPFSGSCLGFWQQQW